MGSVHIPSLPFLSGNGLINSISLQVIRELDTERVAELSLGSENEHEKTLDQLENLRRIAGGLEKMNDDSLDRLLYHTITGGQVRET